MDRTGAEVRADRRRAAELCHHDVRRGYAAAGGRKAVDDRYPLYGTLETQPPGLKPQAGSVLLAPRLMALLNLKTGDTIDVGDATLRIAGEVIQERMRGLTPSRWRRG